jgi:hypothetical protein
MKFLTAFAFVIFLAACGARSSNEQQVRALIASAEAAAEQRDTSDVLQLVADSYQDANGFDKTQLRNFLRAWFLAHPRVELLVNIEKLQFPADGLAQAEISLTNLTLDSPDHARLKVELRRQGSEWRVTRADQLSR